MAGRPRFPAVELDVRRILGAAVGKTGGAAAGGRCTNRDVQIRPMVGIGARRLRVANRRRSSGTAAVVGDPCGYGLRGVLADEGRSAPTKAARGGIRVAFDQRRL